MAERLRESDYRAAMDLLAGLSAAADPAGVKHRLVAGLGRIIPSDLTACFQIKPATRRVKSLTSPGRMADDFTRLVARRCREHPLIAHYRQRLAPDLADGAHKISDFIKRGEWEQNGLCQDLYRGLGMKSEMMLLLAARGGVLTILALHRADQDFSESERAVLNLLQPHLIRTLATARQAVQLRRKLENQENMWRKLPLGVVALNGGNRMVRCTQQASLWLAKYFPGASVDGLLPSDLADWLKKQDEGGRRKPQDKMVNTAFQRGEPDRPAAKCSGGDSTKPARLLAGPARPLAGRDACPANAPDSLFVKRRGEEQLMIRLIRQPDPHAMLILEEKKVAVSAERLQILGLSLRRAEVLLNLTRGQSNREIGARLGISSRTVQKHLEGIFVALGVASRTAACATAWRHLAVSAGTTLLLLFGGQWMDWINGPAGWFGFVGPLLTT
ncbi:MAG: LuxR C-terminal-related transcriptional regulator [Planctomycetes bacterium]|nr:LuxR C-terminal-related transcriptional regulator [Planctomycetota bacterium]